MRMGRSFLKWYGPQMTFKTKIAFFWLVPCSFSSVMESKIWHPQHSPSQNHAAQRKAMKTISPKERCLSMHSGAFFWRSVRLTGLILICSILSCPTPPTRDTWHFLRASLLFSAVLPKKTQKEHVQPHTHSKIEFAAEDLLMSIINQHKLRNDQMWNRSKCKANPASLLTRYTSCASAIKKIYNTQASYYST